MNAPTGGGSWVVDVIALVFVGWYAVSGWRMGLVRSLVLIVGFVLAVYCGARFAPGIGDAFGAGMSPGVRYGIAFVLVFAVVMILSALVGRFLGKVVSLTPVSLLDKAGGALFGGLKAVLFLAIIAVLLAMIPISSPSSSVYMRSRVVQTSLSVGRVVLRTVEPYVAGPLADFIEKASSYFKGQSEEMQRRAREGRQGI